jgi:hypothetical protein
MENHITTRNSNIELFRFILMIGICIWHMFVHGFNIKYIGINNSFVNKEYLIYCSLLVPFVNCFMLISEFFGIRYNIHKVIKFIIQASFYYWICFFINYLYNFNLSLETFIYALPISTRLWWFLTDYFIILLLSPFINEGINKIDKKNYSFILISLLFINSVGLYITRYSLGSNLLSLLILYLIGRFMNKYNLVLNKKLAFYTWLLTTILLISIIILSLEFSTKITWLLFSYNNPLIIIQAISLLSFVLSFNKKNFKPFIFLGGNCFAIYLLTEGVGLKLYKYWSDIYINNSILAISIIIICCILIIGINIVQSKLNNIIYNNIVSCWKTYIK